MNSESNKNFLCETVQGASTSEAKIVRQRGVRREYAHVRISVRAGQRGRGVIWEWKVGTIIPAECSSAVPRGIEDACNAGGTGLGVTDVGISVEAGNYHEVESSAESFREAARAATLQAIQQAAPIVLEAMSLVMITLPANQFEVAELAAGRCGGEATPAVLTENGSKALAANVPTACVNELFEEMLRATGGKLTISRRANGYRPRLDQAEEVPRGILGARRR